MRIVIKRNDQQGTFVSSIELPESIGHNVAFAIRANINVALWEMERGSVLVQSCFADLVTD